MKRILVTVVLVSLMTACGSPYLVDDTPPIQNELQIGDRLLLSKTTIIAPQQYRVYFQLGEVVGAGGFVSKLKKFHADCSFELKQPLMKRYEISPQSFAVNRMESYTEKAFLDYEYSGVYIYMDMPNNPEVLRLDCRNPDVDTSLAFTIGLFRQAVGDHIKIQKK